jgi:hypothetical protein
MIGDKEAQRRKIRLTRGIDAQQLPGDYFLTDARTSRQIVGPNDSPFVYRTNNCRFATSPRSSVINKHFRER